MPMLYTDLLIWSLFSALIQVLKPINIDDENKGRICLPDDDNPVAEDQDCYATGWGLVQEDGFPSDKLREVKVKRVSLARCNSLLSYGGRKDETMTCAGYAVGGKDACQNDSGGSMVCKVNGKFLKQIGFASNFIYFVHIVHNEKNIQGRIMC